MVALQANLRGANEAGEGTNDSEGAQTGQVRAQTTARGCAWLGGSTNASGGCARLEEGRRARLGGHECRTGARTPRRGRVRLGGGARMPGTGGTYARGGGALEGGRAFDPQGA
jgi:hypothetical protein